MQAIQTKYIGPTNTRGSRIKAWCAVGSLTIPYPYAMSGIDVHQVAAQKLVNKLGLDYGRIVGGELSNGDYAFVFVGDVA